jgi:uncharacterized protein
MALIKTLKRHALLTYFVLAYVLTWAFWIPMIFTRPSVPFYVVWWVGNIMPSLVGILLTALFSGKSGLGELFRRLGQVRAPLTWYAVVLLLVPGLQLVAFGVPTLLGLTTIAFAWPTVSSVLSIFIFAGLGEELGWRGFALPRLQASQQAFAASLLLGVVWGLWHLPLKIATGYTPLDFIGFFLDIIAYSVLFAWVYNNTKGSLFLMVLFHTVIDIVFVYNPSNTWIVPVLYVILLWVTVTIVVVMAGAARLARSSTLAPA